METTSSVRLCRLCLEATFGSDNLLNIFDDEGSTIASILTKHFWFEVRNKMFNCNYCISIINFELTNRCIRFRL